jgi:hypothetical protein
MNTPQENYENVLGGLGLKKVTTLQGSINSANIEYWQSGKASVPHVEFTISYDEHSSYYESNGIIEVDDISQSVRSRGSRLLLAQHLKLAYNYVFYPEAFNDDDRNLFARLYDYFGSGIEMNLTIKFSPQETFNNEKITIAIHRFKSYLIATFQETHGGETVRIPFNTNNQSIDEVEVSLRAAHKILLYN